MDDFIYRATPWAITLILHNWLILLCSVLIVWAAARAFLRPTRRALLLLYGLLLLAGAFEYEKHGVEVARGTTGYLFSVEHNPALRSLSRAFFVEVLPPALYATSATLLGLAMAPGIWAGLKRWQRPTTRRQRHQLQAAVRKIVEYRAPDQTQPETWARATQRLLIVPHRVDRLPGGRSPARPVIAADKEGT